MTAPLILSMARTYIHIRCHLNIFAYQCSLFEQVLFHLALPFQSLHSKLTCLGGPGRVLETSTTLFFLSLPPVCQYMPGTQTQIDSQQIASGVGGEVFLWEIFFKATI